jgi:hypothetical protein
MALFCPGFSMLADVRRPGDGSGGDLVRRCLGWCEFGGVSRPGSRLGCCEEITTAPISFPTRRRVRAAPRVGAAPGWVRHPGGCV